MSKPYRYAPTQIGLHWLILALVAFQFLTGDGMQSAFARVHDDGGVWSGTAVVHGILGLTILTAMLVRLNIRRNVGAPPPPETEPEAIQKVSRGVHYAFYVVLIAMPLAGLTAILTGSGLIAWLHGLTSWLLLALIAAHVAGALWHAIKRDGTLYRILPGDRNPASTTGPENH